jgi:hypothetical protein
MKLQSHGMEAYHITIKDDVCDSCECSESDGSNLLWHLQDQSCFSHCIVQQ